MKLTSKWLKEKSACSGGIAWFEKCGLASSVPVLKKLISEDHLDWANWLIVRLMDRKQKIQYAIFAAESVLEVYEKRRPGDDRPRKAIEAAKAVLQYDSAANRKAAAAYAAAAYAAYAAADAAAAAYAAYAAAADAADAARKKLRLKILSYGMKLLDAKRV